MKTIINSWTELGQWRIGPGAPNGSVSGCRERGCVRVEIVENCYGHLDEIRSPMYQDEFQDAPRLLPGLSMRPYRPESDPIRQALRSIRLVEADPQIRAAVETVCRSAGVRW